MNMLQFDIATAITLLLFGLLTACLEFAFQHYLEPDMIFERYGRWLESMKSKPIGQGFFKQKFNRFIKFLIYPLGYCPYCNGTWVTLILYWIIWGFNLNMVFSIGTFWMFARLIDTLGIKK